jgi:hypothetical protein
MIDFTSHLGHALTFAAIGEHDKARVAVLPLRSFKLIDAVVDLRKHPWAERPRRQQGFGIVMPTSGADLKSETARSLLGVEWYEFPIAPSDRDELVNNHRQITLSDDDPSAPFLRFHITEYVEECGKMSEVLADWLLERIPIAPRRYRIIRFEAGQPVVHFCPPSDVLDFDESSEKNHSRCYWSGAACSRDRMKNWNWPTEGSTVTDPRTHHPDLRPPAW